MATDVDQTAETTRVAREYFAALGNAERDAQQRYYAQDVQANLHGIIGPTGRDEVAGFFSDLFDAFPDWRLTVVETVAEGDGVAVRWRARGTFAGPGTFMGFEPNGARVELEGIDLVRVRDGRIALLDGYLNGADLARQLGALPPQGSATEQRMAKAFNLTTRVKRRLASGPEPVADGVWVVRGGLPTKEMNVYLVRDGDGVMLFDAGIKAMTGAVAAAGASLGGITRVVLGHGHPDHRGVAPYLGVPVLCHPDNREDAEGDGGMRYFDFSKLKPYAKPVFPYLLRMWDGGPVTIAATVSEGDELAGFEVVLLEGHAPGLIGLWRASDRLALVSDCFYTLDPQTGRHGHPRVPHEAFNHDTEQARASIRKLAAMEPAAAWAGHAEPLAGDVRGQLEHAAATT